MRTSDERLKKFLNLGGRCTIILLVHPQNIAIRFFRIHVQVNLSKPVVPQCSLHDPSRKSMF